MGAVFVAWINRRRLSPSPRVSRGEKVPNGRMRGVWLRGLSGSMKEEIDSRQPCKQGNPLMETSAMENMVEGGITGAGSVRLKGEIQKNREIEIRHGYQSKSFFILDFTVLSALL